MYKEKITKNLKDNLQRVENLVLNYESQPDATGAGRKEPQLLDTLRAAVVLLHASLEDVIRTASRGKLPLAEADVLNDIPLASLGRRPAKFWLGDLAEFRGKSVDKVIDESIEKHLGQSNYNSVNEIKSALDSIGVETQWVETYRKPLDELMNRRHQIVHRADRREQVRGSGDHKVETINKGTVREWARYVQSFTEKFLIHL